MAARVCVASVHKDERAGEGGGGRERAVATTGGCWLTKQAREIGPSAGSRDRGGAQVAPLSLDLGKGPQMGDWLQVCVGSTELSLSPPPPAPGGCHSLRGRLGTVGFPAQSPGHQL